ncbi:MAG: hypothetical protein AB1679_14185 [Actinomycetota bacterium]
MPEMTTTQTSEGRDGWRTVRHYAYVRRPYEAVWAKLAEAPRDVFRTGDDLSPTGLPLVELRVVRAGIAVSRAVNIKFGGLVAEEEMARMGLRWEDRHHPQLFPVLEGILSLTPISAGRRQVTQVGLVGRYRPPFGALGAVGDRMGGENVAVESVAGFVDHIARRLEALVDVETLGPEPSERARDEADDSDHRRILVPLDGLGERRGGALGVDRQLAGTPGVIRALVDPVAGMAEIEYDPDLCSLSRILAELEVDGPPQEPADSPGS